MAVNEVYRSGCGAAYIVTPKGVQAVREYTPSGAVVLFPDWILAEDGKGAAC